MKMFAVCIGKQTYAIEAEDVADLLRIADRMRKLRRDWHEKLWKFHVDDEPLVTWVEMVNVEVKPTEEAIAQAP